MWQGKVDDDTRVAVAAETEEKMWIQEDTHEMFEDPDITLKAFRDMRKGGERPSSPENLGVPRGSLQVKTLRIMGPPEDRKVRMKGLCGRSYTTRSSWIESLWI